jgi:hypothetical protein
MTSVEELRDNAICLLKEAGFDSDLYIIKMHESSVCIHFDDPGAVEYFKGEVENCEWAEEVIFESRREGKRYVAALQFW